MRESILRALEKKLKSYVDAKKVGGFAVSLTVEGEAPYVYHCGSYTENTLYRIFSMSKPITAIAALMLYERGELRFSDLLTDYIPEFNTLYCCDADQFGCIQTKKVETPITLQHLLTMTTGIGYGFSDALFEKESRLFLEEIKQGKWSEATSHDIAVKISEQPLAFEPGNNYFYGWNTFLLGRVIEVITGETLGDFMQQNIFTPLNMKDTTFNVTPSQKERLAPLWVHQNGKSVVTEEDLSSIANMKAHLGGEGLISSLEDCTRFARMLTNRGEGNGSPLIGRKSFEMMQTNHLTGKALDTFSKSFPGYGYGLTVRTRTHLEKGGISGSIGEIGWGGAAATYSASDPNEKFSFVCMTQLLNNPHNFLTEFHQLAYSALS